MHLRQEKRGICYEAVKVYVWEHKYLPHFLPKSRRRKAIELRQISPLRPSKLDHVTPSLMEKDRKEEERGEIFHGGKISLKIVGMAVTHGREKSPLKPLFSPTLWWPQKMSQKASIQERPGLKQTFFLPLEEQLARGGFNSRGRGGEELNRRTQVSF